MSCMEPVTDNQRLSIADQDAVDFRSGVIEWLMTNHPHDCAVCDEGGSCHLQDMTVMTGHAYRRYAFKKRTHVNQDLGPFLNHEMNRCIQCYRCVRFYKDYAGGEDLDVFASKSNVYFGRHEPGTLESEFSGNLSEVCPTGVFTDKTFKQHYTRKWDLTMAPSICQHCSLGCNTIAGERYGELRMVGNRYHGEINGYFICDRGRFGYEFVNAKDRINAPMHLDQLVDADVMVREVSALLRNTNVIGIGSPRASLQSNFALKRLVGDANFFSGVSGKEQKLTEHAVNILREGPARSLSMKEVEKCDAVFVLGEDLTNTAPMLALAVRQSVRQLPMQEVNGMAVPEWNDAAAREIIQDKKGPLFIATVAETKLDNLALKTFHAATDDLARLGFAVAHAIDPSAPEVVDLNPEEKSLAQAIAQSLKAAKAPVIISGTSCRSDAVLKAAGQVAMALQKHNQASGIVLTMDECNSAGSILIGGRPLEEAFERGMTGIDTLIILENDLYRHSPGQMVDEFLSQCKTVVVIDHTRHATSRKAQWLIPAGTFAEADGTIVNNEGRAQRYFQVYEKAEVKESWRWLAMLGSASGNVAMEKWQDIDSLTNDIAQDNKELSGIKDVTPPSANRMADGQRVPRQPHRYSGRTSMNAHQNISEAKPPADTDSGMSYTMEGSRALPPSAMIPFFWSPGWNSVQSVNKYQEEVGAHLRGGDPGIQLFTASPSKVKSYSTEIPSRFKAEMNKLWVVPIHHIYGSEELSAMSAAVNSRVPDPYILLNKIDMEKLKLNERDELEFEIDGQVFRLPVQSSNSISAGMAGMPVGLPKLSYADLPGWGSLRK